LRDTWLTGYIRIVGLLRLGIFLHIYAKNPDYWGSLPSLQGINIHFMNIYTVPAVYDVLAARIRALRSKDPGR
jgi:hypothetical protein